MTTNPEVLRLAREIVKAQPTSYNDIKDNLSDAVICYGDPTGCVRDDGCEVECLMLATWRHGVEVGAIAAIERTTELAARHLAVRHGLEMDGTEGGENDEPCLDFVTLQNYDHLRQPEKDNSDAD